MNDDLVMDHAYRGPSFNSTFIERLITQRAEDLNSDEFTISPSLPEDLIGLFSSRNIKGNVVGWFQGNMEWGPRALGNNLFWAILGGVI